MRTFVAIEVSQEIKDILGRIESHLKYSGADVKWVKPDNIHLTLKFLGEISAEKTEEIKLRIDSVTASFKSFDLGIKDIGAFPEIDSPRVIWAGLDKGAADTAALAGHIDESLSRIGFAKDRRPFSPHLTIGRVRSPLNRAKLSEKISSTAANFQLSSVTPHRVSSVILFRSTLTPQGSVYTKLHESPLA